MPTPKYFSAALVVVGLGLAMQFFRGHESTVTDDQPVASTFNERNLAEVEPALDLKSRPTFDDSSLTSNARPSAPSVDLFLAVTPPFSEYVLASPKLSALQSSYENEPHDVQWAPGMVSTLYGVLASIDLPYVTTQAQCRTTICRVELAVGPSLTPDGLEGKPYQLQIDSAFRSFIDQDDVNFNHASGVHTGSVSGSSLLYLYIDQPATVERIDLEAIGARRLELRLITDEDESDAPADR